VLAPFNALACRRSTEARSIGIGSRYGVTTSSMLAGSAGREALGAKLLGKHGAGPRK
jgi:hypothetical protein